MNTIEEVFPDAHPGKIVRGFRVREDITQEELAHRLGISQACVSEIESGKRPISHDMAKCLAEAFHTSPRVFESTMTYKGFTGTAEYSEEDACLFGRISGISDIISYEGESITEIRKAFEDSVDDYLKHCADTGKEPNNPHSGNLDKIEDAH